MSLSRLHIISVVVALVVTLSEAAPRGRQMSDQARPASPVAPADSPVLSPDQEMKTFTMPAGYRVELVVSEPLIEDPVLIDWDPDGRMWAIEMPGYMVDIQGTNERAPIGRVVVLEDMNNDGRMDKRTVFADGLILPRALKVLDHGVLVGEPPHLWLMRDTNGDLKADAKTLVTDTYGRFDASVEHNANALTWALDNWMYTSEVDMFLRLKHGEFEVRKTLARGQWGASQDDAGRVYRNTNESVLHVDLVPTQYFARNPNLLRTRGSYESLEGADEEANIVWPSRQTFGVNRGYQTGVLRPDGTLARFTSVSSPTVYRGDRLPAELSGNVFVAEPAANVVGRIIISDDGKGLTARKAYEQREFLAATDERFRPVYLSNAPDGTLYVVDMYRGIIQHKGYITEYLRDYIMPRNLEAPIARGRIYRVVHDTTVRGPKPSLQRASSAELARTLSHPNGWWRDTAQRLLVERGDVSIAPVLSNLATTAPMAVTRLHALWALDGMDRIDAAAVVRALGDSSRDVRVSAVRLAERWLGEANGPVRAAVLARLDDADWAVSRQLGASIAALPAGVREETQAALLARRGDDPVTMDATMSGMRGEEVRVLARLVEWPAETVPLRVAVTMLSATIVRAGQDASAQTMFTWIAEASRPEWQRSAMMRGGEIALLGAAMPGAIGRPAAVVAATAPVCPTCPGARGGPGGAPAFPASPATPTTVSVGRSTGPALRLTHEPALGRVADADTGVLGQRAVALLGRIEWPGKPGARAAAAPLSADEQRRFTAGKEIYLNICQACHQADGRGLDRVAPALLGSALALGPGDVAARILIAGKEGAVGLMPPLGAALNDDQIASVLTYVRREWGQTADPVQTEVVQDVRRLTADRLQPWTNEELARISAGR